MARTLDVYLHERLAGHLGQDDSGQIHFEYTEAWLSQPGSTPLSQSLPLRKASFNGNECRAYFAGILPEGAQREIIARNLGISARNDYAMLERIGGECAGAVSFTLAGEAPRAPSYGYRKLSGSEIAAMIRVLPKRPLLAGEDGIRLSLAGAQDKIAVRVEDGEISIPLGGAPSTHILKPAVERFEGLVFNEGLCMKLAATAGLPAARVEARAADGIDFLLVERYDRRHQLERLHQEDFCQAMGIAPDRKYQKEGGPSLQQCFALLREVSSTPAPDLAKLLDAVAYNAFVGNNDAHGKNFSLLYTGRQTRLAPLYDTVSTVYYPALSRTMAMRIGREYSSDRVSLKNFDELAEEAGLGKALVKRRVSELAETVVTALDDIEILHPAAAAVAALIRERCQRLLAAR